MGALRIVVRARRHRNGRAGANCDERWNMRYRAPLIGKWEGAADPDRPCCAASMDQQGEIVMADTLETNETHRLIASDKVEGTESL